MTRESPEVRSDKMRREEREEEKKRRKRGKRRKRRKRRKIMENLGASWNIMDHHGIEN